MKAVLICLGLLALFSAVTVWKARQSEMQTRQDVPPLGEFVRINGQDIHYLQAGDGPDIVLIHGAGGNLRDFSFDLVDRLRDRYRVTVFDRPGLGYSSRYGYRGVPISEQAEILAQASEAVGVANPIVLGHSYGAAVSLAWATADPVSSVRPAALVQLGGVSHPWDSPPSLLYRTLSHPIFGPVLATLITAWVPDGYVGDSIASVFTPQPMPEGYARYIGAGLTLHRDVLQENARQRVQLLDQVRGMVDAYPDLSLPIEILHGDADTTVWLTIHAIPLSTEAQDANLVVMEGIGHAPHHSDPSTVVDAIDRAATRAGLR
jgi:pimeloyl-ACP methyl ester carboxylesterase